MSTDIHEFKRDGKPVVTPRERDLLKAFRALTPEMRTSLIRAFAWGSVKTRNPTA